MSKKKSIPKKLAKAVASLEEKQWIVYMLRCKDGSLYTGITNELTRRLDEHNDSSKNSKAARYTRARQPVKLFYFEKSENRQEASKREYALKRFSKAKKESLTV